MALLAGAVVLPSTQHRHPYIVWASAPHNGRVQLIPVVNPVLPRHRADLVLSSVDLMACALSWMHEAVAECGRMCWRHGELFVPVAHVPPGLWDRLHHKVERDAAARRFEDLAAFRPRGPFADELVLVRSHPSCPERMIHRA